jgi:hypothetical protein
MAADKAGATRDDDVSFISHDVFLFAAFAEVSKLP